MKATFDNTVSILVKAYLNDTLVATDCCACAVGNIISEANPEYNFYKHDVSWYTACGLNTQEPDYMDNNHPDIIKSGYSLNQLVTIEGAFMVNSLKDNFEGLMAVVDVLAEIHGINLEQKESAKSLFVKWRLPRKLKKQVKKKVAKKTALKITMSAMVSARTMAQNAIIAATPGYVGQPGIALKALSVAQNVIGAAKAIQNIMAEPPNSWKDFIKQS